MKAVVAAFNQGDYEPSDGTFWSTSSDPLVTPGCQDTLEQLPEGNLFRFPAAGNAFTLTFYRDAAARAAAQREQLRPAGYEETYDCIACTLVTNGGYLVRIDRISPFCLYLYIYIHAELAPTYYPPYPADDTFPAFP